MTKGPRKVLLALLGAGVLAAPVTRAAEIRGHISGEDGKPVARAVVRVVPDPPISPGSDMPARVETGADGGFVAQGLQGELFRLRIEAKGYAPLTQPQIPAGATVRLRLRRGVSLAGIVRDRATHEPIGGATVTAWEKDAEGFGEESYRKAKGGKDGRFEILDLPQGKVTVEAEAAGHAPARSGNVALPKTDLYLYLDLAGGLSGRIIDTGGAPIEGAEVEASWRDASGAKRRRAVTDAEGRYRIADAGEFPIERVTVRAAKFLLARREGPGGGGVADVVLERGGSITGRVRGYDGAALPSFAVRLHVERPGEGDRPPSLRERPDQEFTDQSGEFRVDELDPGRYTIEIVADRYATLTKSGLDVVAERIADAGALTLPSRASLRGRVFASRDRAPVASAAVRVALASTPGRADEPAVTAWTATTATDGTFAVFPLPQGTFEIALEHPMFAPSRTRLTFHPDTDTPELVMTMSRGGSLTGTVVDANHDPVEGVRIAASQDQDADSRVADTGPDGRYFIDGLAPGTYNVTRRQDDPASPSAAATKLAAIREDETTTLDFDEKPRILLTGAVLKGGSPVPGAGLYFVAMDGDGPRDAKSVASDADGNFLIGLGQPGRYQVSVVFGKAGGATGRSVVTLTIPDRPEVSQNIVFTFGTIAGRVADTQGKGINGAMVTATRDGGAPGEAPRQSTSMSRDDGLFRLEAIDPGTYRVTARARGYTAAEIYPVAAREDAPSDDLELTLERGWTMRGRLVDPEGRGVPDALVVVAPPGMAESGFLPSQTDPNGLFRITAPTDGRVNVAAIARHFAPAVQTNIDPPASENPPEVVLRASLGGTLRVRVARRGGNPVAGAQVTYQPIPLFPGSDVVVDRNRPGPTDVAGITVLTRLHPGEYVVSIAGRRDSAPVQVGVNDGEESSVVLEVP